MTCKEEGGMTGMGEMEEGAAGDRNQENTCRRLLKNRIEDATPVFKCTTLANVPLTKASHRQGTPRSHHGRKEQGRIEG